MMKKVAELPKRSILLKGPYYSSNIYIYIYIYIQDIDDQGYIFLNAGEKYIYQLAYRVYSCCVLLYGQTGE